MTKNIFIIGIGIVILFTTCRSASKESLEPGTASDSEALNESPAPVPADVVSSSAAVENNKDSSRKFIRTAELKFKVKSVIKSTYDIENITDRNGGFVTYTNLNSSIESVTRTMISPDSSLVSTFYSVTNSITLRVPNTNLDTTLREIARNIDYLDFRIIKADDVALQMLSNLLTQKRSEGSERRLNNAIQNQSKKVSETERASELLENKQEQSDDARIRNLQLKDQVEFSTVNLTIYQQQTLRTEMVPNHKEIRVYKPGFGQRMVDSIVFGWRILEGIILLITKIWAIILIAFVSYLVYVIYFRKEE